MADNVYTIDRGKICSAKGLPLLPRWFCDDIVSIQADRYGISAVQYFGGTKNHNVNLFVADMWGGMKLYIDDYGKKTYMNLYDTEVMPYGFCAKWKYKQYTFRFEERIINNSIYFSIEPESRYDEELALSIEFYDAFALIPPETGDYRYKTKGEGKRTWKTWATEDNYLYTSFEAGGDEIYTAIGSNTRLAYEKRTLGFVKHILTFKNIAKETVRVAMSFDTSKEKVFARAEETLSHSVQYIEKQNTRYQKVMDKAPVLQSPYRDLNNFFALAPLYHESFKLAAYKGAIRARTNKYWVWGWDGMTASFTYGYWGELEFISNMLHFYMETADPEKGICHCFNRDMSHGETSMVAAQGFYINLLYQYYINGGDISLYYGFAKKILGMIFDQEVGGLGLCSGYSLVPDFREVILETGNDISCFNNTSAYCAVRAMEEMSKALGDMETSEKAAAFAARTRAHFNELLYDEEAGYYVSSVDSITLQKRMTYMGMEVKWDNQFCKELVGETQNQCLEFFEEKLVCKAGIRTFPIDGIGFDADANQAHCWWPPHSEYYARMINEADRNDLIEQFIGWISSWTRLLMCPEGINCYADTEEPFTDCWNGEPGIWQAFSLRAWYEASIHSFFGIDADRDGINIYPRTGEEMSLSGLHYQNKTLDIYMKGSGTEIESVMVNDVPVGSIRKIPADMLKAHNVIIVNRRA